jgi:hypothetical protein
MNKDFVQIACINAASLQIQGLPVLSPRVAGIEEF